MLIHNKTGPYGDRNNKIPKRFQGFVLQQRNEKLIREGKILKERAQKVQQKTDRSQYTFKIKNICTTDKQQILGKGNSNYRRMLLKPRNGNAERREISGNHWHRLNFTVIGRDLTCYYRFLKGFYRLADFPNVFRNG